MSRNRQRRNGAGRRNGSSGTRERVRYAVIGLGHIAQVAMLPAFAHARANSALTALVSDHAGKLGKLGKRYRVPLLCRYENMDELFASGEIDAVYIALPNSMHCDVTVRAANAGLHVLCEKPMAVTSAECERMIAAARANDVQLMIAYRLHFERANLELADIARSGRIGPVRYFDSQFSMQVRPGNIRLDRELGGGALYDIGIYCINAARSVMAAEPLEVWAAATKVGDRRFREVHDTISAMLRFPDERLAAFVCSFAAADMSACEVVGTRGSLRMDPAFEYAEGLAYEQRIGGRTRKRKFGKSDQFAAELLYFSKCVLEGRPVEPSGEEGMADVRVIEALHRSVETGRSVTLKLPQRRRRPNLRQAIRRPPVHKPPLVNVTPASS